MGWFRGNGEGYTRGGMDVESAINLFFKGVLLFPVFLFAGYVGIAMMKHMIFHGVPVMNTVTPEQREVLRERDSQIGLPQEGSDAQVSLKPEEDPGHPNYMHPGIRAHVAEIRREADPRVNAFHDAYTAFGECLEVAVRNPLMRYNDPEAACGGAPRSCHFGVEENFGAGAWCDGYTANGRVRL